VSATAQHMVALNRANAIRLRIAEVKRKVRAGADSTESRDLIAGVLEDTPPDIGAMCIFDLLTAGTRIGRSKARRFLLAAGVPERKPVLELTDRQRTALISVLRTTSTDSKGSPWRQ